MGFFSEMDIEVRDMINSGASRVQIANAYPMLAPHEVAAYFDNDHDGDSDAGEEFFEQEDDGQPTMYEEYQDYMGGDDWDHGQCDE
jgi:hypothetical protein